MRRAARYADGWMPCMYTPEMLRASLDQIAGFAREVGRPADAVRAGLFVFTCVHDDRATALDLATRQLSRQYNQDLSSLVEKYAIAGSPADCVARVQEAAQPCLHLRIRAVARHVRPRENAAGGYGTCSPVR